MTPHLHVARLAPERFGHFVDHTVSLGPGLNVVIGPNEAGKSTLLAFLGWVLFGSRRRDPRASLADGGVGTIDVATPGGTWRLHRRGRTLQVTDPGGQARHRADLLGDLDRTVFDAVFAFDLAEIADMRALEGEALRERLFAAGMTGRGVSSHEIRKKLKGEIQELWRKRARSRYGVLQDGIATIERDLAAATRAVEGLPTLLDRIRALAADVGARDRALEDLRRRRQERIALRDALEDFRALVDAEGRLAAIPAHPRLDGAAWRRIRDLADRARVARDAARTREDERRQATAARDATRRDPRILACSDALQAVSGTLAARREDARAPDTVGPRRDRLDGALEALGCRDPAALKAIRIDAPTVDPLLTEARDLADRRISLASLVQEAARSVDAAQADHARAKEALEALPPPNGLDAHHDHARHLRERWHRDVQPLADALPEKVRAAEAARSDAERLVARAGGRERVEAVDRCRREDLDDLARRDAALAREEAEAEREADDLRRRIADAEGEAARIQADLDALGPPWPGLRHRERIRALGLRAPDAAHRKAVRDDLDPAIARTRTAIDRRCADVGLSDAEAVRRLSLDAAARERIRQAADAALAARRAVEGLPQPPDDGAPAPPPEALDAARRRHQALARLKARLQDAAAGLQGDRRRDRALRTVLVALAVAVGLTGIALGVVLHPAAAVGAIALVLLLLVAYAVLDGGSRIPSDLREDLRAHGLPATAGFADLEAALAASEDTIATLERRAAAEEARRRHAEAARRARETAAALADRLDQAGLPPIPDPTAVLERLPDLYALQREVERLDDRILERDAAAEAWERFAREVADLEAALGDPLPRDTPPDVRLQSLQEGLEAAEAAEETRRRHQADLERSRAALAHLQRSLAEVEERRTRLAGDRKALADALEAAGLPADGPPGGLRDWIVLAREAGHAARRADEAAADAARAEDAVATFREALASLADAVGVPVDDEERTLDAIVARCAEAIDGAARRARAEDRVATTRDALTAAKEDAAQLERRRAALEDAIARWTERATAAGYPSPTPDTFERRVLQAREAREALASWEEAVDTADRRRKRLEDWLARVAEIAAALGETAPDRPEDAFALVERLQARLDDARTQEARWQTHDEALRAADRRARDAADAHRGAREALQAALADAGVDTFDDAEAAHRRQADADDLARTVAELRHRIEARCGRPLDDALRGDLAGGDPATWQADIEALDQEEARLVAERDDLLKRRRDAERARDDLHESADIPRLQAERAALEAERDAVFRRLVHLHLVDHLLERAVERFRDERQPAVLRRAGALLATLTDGAWTHIRPPVDAEDTLEVVSASGEGVRPERLSRGTREQLYLCLRLALADRVGNGPAGPFPLVLDDVLVNFDPRRAAACAHVLADIARNRQVIVFSCRPETKEALAAATSALTAVSLPRFAGAPHPGSRPPAAEAAPPRPAPHRFADVLRARLEEAGRPLSKKELLRNPGEEAEWTRAIRHLQRAGLVQKHGDRRGTKWSLTAAPSR